mmetsp:Transcript_17094/g.20872  ORF Transcript_17094/g.20872 Transcript_17094/m.20872 type:complete len:362 (+) Transcript_17094:65-1150(+)
MPTNQSSSTASSSASPHTSASTQKSTSLKTFLASDELITIIPSFNYKTPISDLLISQTSIQPFTAGIHTTVPLWLGIYLRKRNLCRIVCPPWLTTTHLKKILIHERNPDNTSFSLDIPFRYMEIAKSLIQTIGATRSAIHASGGSGGASGASGGGTEEIPQVEIIRVLLEDIHQVRMDKIRRNIHGLSRNTMRSSMVRPIPVVEVTGIGSVEMSAIKPFLEKSFEDHLTLVRTATAKARVENNGSGSKGTSNIPGSSRPISNLRLSSRKRINNNNTAVDDDDNDDNNDESKIENAGEERQRQSEGNEHQHQQQQQQQQEDYNSENNPDEDDGLMEPTAEEEPNEEQEEEAVPRSTIRRYRS